MIRKVRKICETVVLYAYSRVVQKINVRLTFILLSLYVCNRIRDRLGVARWRIHTILISYKNFWSVRIIELLDDGARVSSAGPFIIVRSISPHNQTYRYRKYWSLSTKIGPKTKEIKFSLKSNFTQFFRIFDLPSPVTRSDSNMTFHPRAWRHVRA